MERRDYLKDQIDKAAQLLGRFLLDYMNQPSTAAYEKLAMEINQVLSFHPDELLHLNIMELKAVIENYHIPKVLLEPLLEVYLKQGEVSGKKSYLRTALQLVNLMDEIENQTTLKRISTRKRIEILMRN